MIERKITELEVEAALQDHHTEYTDKQGNPIYIAHINERRIKIVIKKDSHPPHIITAADLTGGRDMPLTLKYDRDADAIYIQLRDLPYAFGEDIDHERRIDYAEGGEPIGIEILCASGGVDTRGLPNEDAVSRLMKEHLFKVFA